MAGVVSGGRPIVAGGGALWTPLNMAAVPQIYLDAQDSAVTNVSGACSEISNLGAMGADGNFTQSTAARRPGIFAGELNGKRVLRFDGADDCVTCGSSAGRALFRNVAAAWVLSVYKKRGLDATPTARFLFHSLNSAGNWGFLFAAGDTGAGKANKPGVLAARLNADTAAWLYSPNIVQGSYCISTCAVNYATRSAVLRENGAQVAENTAYTTSPGNTPDASSSDPIAVGGFHSGASGADVDLAAIVTGNVYPSAGELEKLEGWAAHKYGLTANLPAGHPYKTAAPTV
jgi:hypothetical protein